MDRRTFLKGLAALTATVATAGASAVENVLTDEPRFARLESFRFIESGQIVIEDAEVIPSPETFGHLYRGIAYHRRNPSQKKYFMFAFDKASKPADMEFQQELWSVLQKAFSLENRVGGVAA